MRFFYYNPETRLGYISDPLGPGDGEALAVGLGIYVTLYIIAALIAAVIVLPFLIVAGLDKFLISFVSVNKNFLIVSAIITLLIKLFTVRLSSVLFIRFIFTLMIIIPVLYILLYKFNMADITISIGKRFEASKALLENTTANSSWADSMIEKNLTAAKSFFIAIHSKIQSIDYSPFSSSLSTINLAACLLAIGKAILWWGILILSSLLLFAAGLIVVVVLVGFPYFIAFMVLALVNNLIYAIKHNYASHLKF